MFCRVLPCDAAPQPTAKNEAGCYYNNYNNYADFGYWLIMFLPSGTVTFLFTDIEGSTALWENQTEAMRAALRHHDALLRRIIEAGNGVVFKTVGDAFCAVFSNAADALGVAVACQQALKKDWPEAAIPLRVRVALHTGAADEHDNDYFGPPVNRVARLLAAGHGQQILVSAATYELVRDRLPENVGLRDLELHRLKDLERSEHVWQVTHPDLPDAFSPLKSLDALPNNLPQQLTNFIGREKEIQAVRGLFQKTRLLTLTGSGGSGKTRLALQTAAEISEAYKGGAWLVEFAPLANSALVFQTVAQVLGVKEQAGQDLMQTLADFVNTKSVLLVLDNCEHVLPACRLLSAGLLRACPHVRILATSREPLGITGEQTYRVPSLSLPDPQIRSGNAGKCQSI